MGNLLTDYPSVKHSVHSGKKEMSDIRAPKGLRLFHLSGQQKQVIPIILLGDILALAIAWQVTSYCNQFYSPLPTELECEKKKESF